MIWPFLVIILIFGINSSYIDIKDGKIRNFHILMAISVGLLVWFFLFSYGFVEAFEFGQTILLGGYGLLVGFFIWLIGLWSAGDAKLFAAYSFLIPASVYKWAEFPLVSLLSNTILPIFIVLIGFLLIKSSWKHKKKALKNILNYKFIFNLLLIVFSLSWVVFILFRLIHIPQNYIFLVFGLLGFMYLIKKVLPKYATRILIGLAIARIIFEFDKIFSFEFWGSFLLLTLGYIVLVLVLKDMSSKYFSKNVEIIDLRPGMIPAEVIIKTKKGYKRESVQKHSLNQFKTKMKGFVHSYDIKGLTNKDIFKIDQLRRAKKFRINTLKIKQTIPFAPFMFFGALITLLIGGNLVLWLMMLF